ncbi:hypothetical protein [Terrabacter carboxydivorans]|uniref:hypothetical protein n=1 Tax=Terrabacter carboxydivorans TaxID=619730 RepID=UPI0031DACAF8
MSDSGFVDEAPSGGGRPSRPGRVPRHTDRHAEPSAPPEPAARARRRPRPGFGTAGFVALVVGLLAFGAWAWSSRVHAGDVAAYESLAREVELLDRNLTPLGHSEVPPCREAPDGAVTRSYPPSTGPDAEQLVTYLVQAGWVRQDSDLPVYAHLTRTVGDHVLTADVLVPSDTSFVGSLSARSPGSSFGCLLH